MSDIVDGVAVGQMYWRVGRRVGRTIYAMAGSAPSDADVLIGLMDTPVLATAVVGAHNRELRNCGVRSPLLPRGDEYELLEGGAS